MTRGQAGTGGGDGSQCMRGHQYITTEGGWVGSKLRFEVRHISGSLTFCLEKGILDVERPPDHKWPRSPGERG